MRKRTPGAIAVGAGSEDTPAVSVVTLPRYRAMRSSSSRARSKRSFTDGTASAG
jgi:hypothetical protein